MFDGLFASVVGAHVRMQLTADYVKALAKLQASEHKSARDVALGYGWICPYCRVPQDEGRQTGVYYERQPVCAGCAPILSAARAAAEAGA